MVRTVKSMCDVEKEKVITSEQQSGSIEPSEFRQEGDSTPREQYMQRI